MTAGRRPATTADPEVRTGDDVRAMFDGIARFYDLLNTVLSGGRDEAWRRRTVDACRLRPGDTAVDVCCGTGRLATRLRRRVGPTGRVIGVDFSEGMLAVARRRDPAVDWRTGDATTLEGIADSSADALTIAFGLRNVQDRAAALRAARRVLRPGGRMAILEFATPSGRLTGPIARGYVRGVLPRIGRLLNPRSGAYTYLPESIAHYPASAEVSSWLRAAGFSEVTVSRLTLGMVTLHVAR